MNQLSDADKIMLEKFRQLSSKQRQSLRDFLDFLLSQNSWSNSENSSGKEEEKQVSFYEATKEMAGALDGLPSDLSTNKKYLENIGK
ncbi:MULTISPECIES: hypothetical protein [Okeania]|uniref:DUF2281 domain-containing protein n=1 Tax=Okeania hirsuta TaxID=1458930 RepID=A0A3N6PLR0_9CYAN|nr:MULTISPECIES: hypothetical protein [Okeania]NEP91304.1 hypothetical protein [Okeania sp. SIO2C2]NES77041.1 hypothetical protein [Okeania sp. SIO1H4]NET18536.1 hypothetical protein [Okeania sp. SIO1H5]NET94879.1 hypothetical protein [Okeania sp. SIO1H2]RQH23996.1 hypothetical protein D4Z78_05165 [Okeania hirsuta]